jgi:predicted transglutaminase-like cysteine proteinase
MSTEIDNSMEANYKATRAITRKTSIRIKRFSLILLLTILHLPAISKIIFSEKLYTHIETTYSADAAERVKKWEEGLLKWRSLDEISQLSEVNSFFNQLEFKDDLIHWNKADYWATPIEFLATQAGDCEDYAIAKYFSLIELGVSENKLRLIYVTALRPRQAHMVLGYYETPESIPLVLDNINKRILFANQRRDLIPIYSFNGTGLWAAKAQGRGLQMRSSGKNSLWDELNERITRGF